MTDMTARARVFIAPCCFSLVTLAVALLTAACQTGGRSARPLEEAKQGTAPPLRPSHVTSTEPKPRAERPTYQVGEKWIRTDGVYELIRIEKDLYIFAQGPYYQVRLTKDLAVANVQRGEYVMEFDPPPRLTWPLEVGKRGVSSGLWRAPLCPSGCPAHFFWKVEAYEDVDVVAGTFKAFRISLTFKAKWGLPWELQTWYAPEVRQFVKAEGNNLELLSFQVVSVDRPVSSPLQVALQEPKDQTRVTTEEIGVTGKVTGGKGVARVTVTLNGQEVSRQEEPGHYAYYGLPSDWHRTEVALKLPLKLREGRNVLLVTAADPAGNTSQEGRVLFYEKLSPPLAGGPSGRIAQRGPDGGTEVTASPPLAGGPSGRTAHRGPDDLETVTASPPLPEAPPAAVAPPEERPSPAPAPEAPTTTAQAPKVAPPVVVPPEPPPVPKPPAVTTPAPVAPPPAVAPPAPAPSPAPAVVAALPPLQVRVSSPLDQARVDQDSIGLAGLLSGGKGVSRVVVTLNGIEVSRHDEPTPQRFLPVNFALKLREGQNTLVLTATETDGTIHQEVRTVHYEKLVPLTVAFRYPEDRARVTEEASLVAAVVTSSKGVAKVSVSLNGREVHQQSERTPSKSLVVTVPVTLREGVNAIVVSASEPDGNARQEIRTVMYDRPKVAVALPASPPAPPAADRWAVVIGVGRYESPGVPTLRYTVADAEAIYQVLTGPAGFKKEHVLLLADTMEKKPTLRNIKWALGTFLARSARKEDTVLIFFAGHGAPETDPQGIERDGLAKYLVPNDADPDDLYSTALPMDEIQTIFGRIEAERVVAFLDTCYSGAAGGRTFASKKTRTISVDELFLERLTRAKGRAIITASRPAEVSMELPELGHGIFTYYLVQGLKGAADLNHDGIVSLQELYEYLEQQVTQKSRAVGGNQHPVMKGEMEGILPLVKVGGP